MHILTVATLAFRRCRFHLVRGLHLLWYWIVARRYECFHRTMRLQCNICGKHNDMEETLVFDREAASCLHCGSNLRYRAIIDILANYLYGKSVVLVDFPLDKSITGLGVSDWKGYAEQLAWKFSYLNTFFHKEPNLDITDIKSDEYGKYDFIIISDVLEHIDLPVSKGICNLYQLLKPNGICIITVPYMNFERTIEHFPDLYHYQITDQDGKQTLVNTTRGGQVQTFTNLEFHGGGGATLEKRIFTRRSLYDELANAGFSEVAFCRHQNLQFGIKWIVNWSLPVSAIKKG